jgi:hypothetical protein
VLDYAKFVNDSGLHYTFNHFLEVLAKENWQVLMILTLLMYFGKNFLLWSRKLLFLQIYYKNVVKISVPPDSARHEDCITFFKADTMKLTVCPSCLSLKYYLAKHRKIMSTLHSDDRIIIIRIKHQDVSSTVPFDFLISTSAWRTWEAR